MRQRTWGRTKVVTGPARLVRGVHPAAPPRVTNRLLRTGVVGPPTRMRSSRSASATSIDGSGPPRSRAARRRTVTNRRSESMISMSRMRRRLTAALTRATHSKRPSRRAQGCTGDSDHLKGVVLTVDSQRLQIGGGVRTPSKIRSGGRALGRRGGVGAGGEGQPRWMVRSFPHPAMGDATRIPSVRAVLGCMSCPTPIPIAPTAMAPTRTCRLCVYDFQANSLAPLNIQASRQHRCGLRRLAWGPSLLT